MLIYATANLKESPGFQCRAKNIWTTDVEEMGVAGGLVGKKVTRHEKKMHNP